MKTIFKHLMLTITLICCSMFFAFAQGNFVIEGNINLAGGGVKENWPVIIKSLSNAPTSNDTVYTNNNGHYTFTIANGAVIGPNMCWEVSTKDTCTPGTIVIFRDTVCNMQGTVSSAVVNFTIGQNCIQNCGAGFQFTLNNQVASFFASAIGTAPINYQWNFGDGSTGTGENPIHTYQSGNYWVCLIITDANGCQSDFCDSVFVSGTNVCLADFTSSINGSNVTFNNLSTFSGSSASYIWSFGDGDSSTVQHPTHTYAAAGTYQACLTITTPNNCTNTFCKNITVTTGSTNCDAAFSYTIQGDTVYFSNNSIPVQSGTTYVSYYWTFGNGTTSNNKNPKKVFANNQTYQICLKITVRNSNQTIICSDSVCQAVVYNPVNIQCDANFNHTVSATGKVEFNNTSAYTSGTNVQWLWNFGNGNTSTLKNPSIQYNAPGTYTVCLKMKLVTSSNVVICEDSVCKTVVIQNVSNHCQADFTAHPVANLRVEFTNTSYSANPNATYYWTYGDSTTATGFAPDHIYTSSGTYTVCLYMFDQTANCRDTICKTVVVGLSTPTCTANLSYNVSSSSIPFVVYFTDASVATNDSIISWQWDFGDSTISNNKNEVHTYNAAGQYVVCLKITTASGCTNTVCKAVTLGNSSSCAANFSFTTSGLVASFTNTSTPSGVSAAYRWTFGDNTSATGQNPVHTYTIAGQYKVCLTISTSNGCVSDVCKYVTVGVNTIRCDAAFTPHVVANNRVEFSNNSVSANQNTTSYKWNFGDGTGSNLFAPDHIYQTAGTYRVCLFLYDQTANCRDTVCKQVVVNPITPNCDASFSYTVIGNRVEFHSTSVPMQNTTGHYWSFGDGTTSTLINPQHIFANPGSYTVCLTIINSLNGCTDDVCHTIVIGSNQQQFCISGKICKGINSNAAFPATVFLIYYDSIQGTLTAVKVTSTNQSGEYQFCNVAHGKYLVKAALTPNAPDYNNFMPTYYGNSLFWNYAIPVVLNQNRQQVDICLIAGNNPGGRGFVGGYVQQGANKTGSFAGDAMVGVQVFLLDLNDNPLQVTYSVEEGRFTFEDVADGTYKVYAEVLGKETIPYIVTINSEQPEKDNILLLVESTQVISSIDEKLVSAIRSLHIYPNPTADMINLELNLKNSAEVNISITDITGKVIVEDILNGTVGEQTHRINMASHQQGVYFIRINQGDVNKIMKLMKY